MDGANTGQTALEDCSGEFPSSSTITLNIKPEIEQKCLDQSIHYNGPVKVHQTLFKALKTVAHEGPPSNLTLARNSGQKMSVCKCAMVAQTRVDVQLQLRQMWFNKVFSPGTEHRPQKEQIS